MIEVFALGELGKPATRSIFVEKAHAYGSLVHVGLGERLTCDVRVIFPGGTGVTASGIAADRAVTIDRDTGQVSSGK